MQILARLRLAVPRPDLSQQIPDFQTGRRPGPPVLFRGVLRASGRRGGAGNRRLVPVQVLLRGAPLAEEVSAAFRVL